MSIKKVIALAVSLIWISFCSDMSYAESPIDSYLNWDNDLKSYTKQTCQEYDVDYSLALAVIYNESRFQSGLTHKNSNGTIDYGLMQVNEVNFDFLQRTVGIKSMKDLLNDKIGIRCGVELLAYHKDFTGEDSSALLRYQIGAGKYRQYTNVGKYTNDTHSKVWQYREIYNNYLSDLSKQNDYTSESKLDDFVKKDPIAKIFDMWAGTST